MKNREKIKETIKKEVRKILSENPQKGNYNRALEVVESYEDKNQLEDFKSTFSKDKNITKKQWFDWNEQYIDDMSELRYIEQHWYYIVTGDDSVYDEEHD